MKRIFSLILIIVMIFSIMSMELYSITTNATDIAITEYTITYHLDGGTNALKNPDVYTFEDIITLKDATKVGYNFVGWYLDEAKTEQITEISNRTGNLDLYAKFAPKTYTATFNDNGATKSSDITITMDDTIGTSKVFSVNNDEPFNPYLHWIPKRDGYVFIGWYYGSQLLKDELYISSELTLTAKWSECDVYTQDDIYYSKTYRETPIVLGSNSNGIYSQKTKFYDVDSNLNLGYDALIDNYAGNYHSRWSCIYIYVSAGYEELRYSAQYLSSYYDQGFFEIYDQTKKKELVSTFQDSFAPIDCSGSLVVEPGTLLRIKVGFVEGPYYDDLYDKDMYGQITIELGRKRNCSIYAKNERISTQKFDSYINTPSVTKIGYDFEGWYDVNENAITDTWKYTENQTFIAKWQPIKHNITYNLDGGTNSASNPYLYTIEDSIILKDPSKAGYTFKGWYSDSNFNTKITNISNQTGNIVLYAKWEVNRYNITLDANEGAFAPKVTFVSDGVEIKNSFVYPQNTITAYRPADKEGYIFAGWYKDASFTELFKFNGTITEDVTLYAKWIECSDKVINIESVDSIETTVAGKTEQLYAFVPLVDGKIVVTSASDGLDLYGILYDDAKNELIVADDISDNDLDFSYAYDVKAGQLYYIAVKGNTVSTKGKATIDVEWTGACTITGTTWPNMQVTVVYDTRYTLPEKPVRDGYIFLGWFDETDTQITDGIWNFTNDKTLTAKWVEVTYHTVTFKDENGKIISSDTYCLLDEIVAPEFPTKSPDHICSYRAKWDNNYTGVCTGDAVYTVVFEIDEYVEYTVEFKNWNGEIVSTQTYHYGDTIIPPKNPTRTSDDVYTYTFAGWDMEVSNCTGYATFTATYSSNLICYSEGLDYSLNADGMSYSVTGIGTCTDTDLIIFAAYNGLPVTGIGAKAFNNCTSLTSITLRNSVTSIANYAFYNCASLTSIYFNGTISQWNNIPKGAVWNYNTGDYVIYCTDGKILKVKEDIEDLKEKCLEIEAEISDINALISKHSPNCDNSECTIDQIIYDFECICAKFDYFKYQIATLDAKICELENAEEIDVKKINELKVEIEGLDYRYVGGVVIDADLAALRTDIDELYAKELIIFGDIDGNGTVEIKDAEVLLKFIIGGNVIVVETAIDVNRDGEVNIRDAAMILLFLDGKITSLN